MKHLSQIVTQYRSVYAAAKALNVSATQLHRLIAKGALVAPSGAVYIESKTKLELKKCQK